MANTSVHLPESLLADLNRLAAERGVSRNALIVESCRRLVAERSIWPEGLFADDRFTADDLEELRQGEEEFLRAVRKARKSRKRPPF